MTKEEKTEFIRYIDEMLRKGWRGYIIEGKKDYENLSRRYDVRIETYDFAKIVLVRDNINTYADRYENESRVSSSEQGKLQQIQTRERGPSILSPVG